MHSPQPRPAAPSVGILVAVSMLQPIGINMFVPSIPGMRVAFATDATTIQLTISLYLVATAVAMLVLGPLSDRFGRRPVLLVGLACFVVGSAAAAVAETMAVLLAARAVQAVGASAGLTLARAIVRDVYDRERSASVIGYVTMGMSVAPMLAPVAGGVIDEFVGWRASFWAMGLFGIAVMLAALPWLPETHVARGTAAGPRALLASFAELLRMRAFWIYTGAVSLASAVFYAFIGGATHVASTVLKLSPSVYGVYFILIAFGYLVGNYLSGRYAARLGLRTMINLGNLVSLASLAAGGALAALHVPHPLAFFGPLLFVTLGTGLALPSGMAGGISVRPDLSGAAAGLMGSLQVGLGALSTVAVGRLFDAGLLPGTAWFVLIPMIAFGIAAAAVGLAAPRG